MIDHDADAGGTLRVFQNDWLRSSWLLLRLVLLGSFPLAAALALTHTFLPSSCRDGGVLAQRMGGFSPIAMDAEGDSRRELSFERRCVRRDAGDSDGSVKAAFDVIW
jgi:hypothetical protein